MTSPHITLEVSNPVNVGTPTVIILALISVARKRSLKSMG
jgi:hypothetical protein